MATKEKKKKSLKERITGAPGKTFRSMISGGVISMDFFNRHKLKLFVALVLIVFYISTKYQCQTGMETIRRLENQLEIVRAESIRERSEYMSRIRESSMTVLADSIRPGLAVQTQPPYVLPGLDER